MGQSWLTWHERRRSRLNIHIITIIIVRLLTLWLIRDSAWSSTYRKNPGPRPNVSPLVINNTYVSPSINLLTSLPEKLQ